MKCPKCRYSSFPHLENCPKCGFGLAEQRAALGVYALPPDPPDLLLAYQASTIDATAGAPTPSLSAPDLDLGQLEGIDPEIAEVKSDGAEVYEVEEPTNADLELLSTLEPQVREEEEPSPMDSGSERLGSQDRRNPPSLELSELGDITLAIEDTGDLGGESPPSAQPLEESAGVRPVYDLDLDEDLDGLTLGSQVDEARVHDDDDDEDDVVEYTLQIEEEVEFEIEELELERDDEEDEDGDQRF